jgi:hypothetical protein
VIIIIREALNNSRITVICHSGESRNPVKTIIYWMPFFNGMTTKELFQTFIRGNHHAERISCHSGLQAQTHSSRNIIAGRSAARAGLDGD